MNCFTLIGLEPKHVCEEWTYAKEWEIENSFSEFAKQVVESRIPELKKIGGIEKLLPSLNEEEEANWIKFSADSEKYTKPSLTK